MRYLTADECTKCFILIGTPPGIFSHCSILASSATHIKLVWSVAMHELELQSDPAGDLTISMLCSDRKAR